MSLRQMFLAVSGALCVVAGVSIAESASAASYVLDFEKDDIAVGDGTIAGDIISDQWAEDLGVKLSAESKNGGSRNLLLFNSNCGGDTGVICTGGDSDLATGDDYGTPGQNNILIMQEGKDFTDPDDNGNGGNIIFDFFKGAVNLQSISLVDVDDDGSQLEKVGFSALVNGTWTDMFAPELGERVTRLSPGTGDNSLYEINLAGLFGSAEKFQVHYEGSGAIASLEWDTNEAQDIPEPTAVLSLMGVGALGAVLSRKRQSAAS